MKRILFILLTCLIFNQAFAQSEDKRFFELRVYYCYPGKLDALINRFQTVTTRLFEKHGMENIGYWVPVQNDKNALYYILAFPDKASRDKSWATFGADPEWKQAAAKSEENGKIVESVSSIYMSGADVIPRMTNLTSATERVFELRTYYCFPGKVPDITKRFRNHSVKILEQHHMPSLAYFLTEERDGSQAKLVYILGHSSEQEAAKNWEEFRADPVWIKVKADSEADGKIVEKVESVFLKPLSFSKIH